MRSWIKRIIKWVIWGIILLIPLNFLTGYLLRILLVKSMDVFAGLKASVGRVMVGALRSDLLEVRDFKIFQPEAFPPGPMAYIPRIYLDYQVIPLLRKKFLISRMSVHIQKIYVVRNREGEFNIVYLLRKKRGRVSREREKLFTFRIKNLELRIDQIIFEDYYRRKEPRIKEISLQFKESFQDVDSLSRIGEVVFPRIIARVARDKIFGIIPLPSFSFKEFWEKIFPSYGENLSGRSSR